MAKNMEMETLTDYKQVLKASELKISYYPKLKLRDCPVVTSSVDVNNILKPFFSDIINYSERFVVVCLNRANRVIGIKNISDGGQCAAVVDIKMIFQVALLSHANQIIVAHNHPSGNLRPSHQDIELNKKIIASAKFLEIPLIDSLILTQDSYFSFADEGMLNS